MSVPADEREDVPAGQAALDDLMRKALDEPRIDAVMEAYQRAVQYLPAVPPQSISHVVFSTGANV